MSEFKIVYLIIERGAEQNRQTLWRPAGVAFMCRDGSMNVKLDIHPGLTFNVREPKSMGEREEAEFPNVANGNGHQAPVPQTVPETKPVAKAKPKASKPEVPPDDDIPF